jgi:hypothetical protein
VIEAAALDQCGTATLRIHTSRSGRTEPASVLELKRFKGIVPTLETPRTIEVDAGSARLAARALRDRLRRFPIAEC